LACTFNIERETLIQILDYAMCEGLILENPAKMISRRKEHRVKVVIPTKAQFKTLLDTLRQSDVRYHSAADLCELLAYSGCRLAEATSRRSFILAQARLGLTTSNTIPPASASAPATGGIKWLCVVSKCIPRKSTGFPGVLKVMPE
jgi:hypothetical protein